MATYILIPEDGTLTINNQSAFGVDYSGIDPDIHAICWYDVEGSVEYVGNPITGAKPNNSIISDITPYLSYITQAQNIINAADNPQYFYAEADGVEFGGDIFQIGERLAYSEYPPLAEPPPGFTVNPSLTASGEGVYLQWTGINWVTAAFPYDLTLQQAQNYLNTQVNVYGAKLINNQLRQFTFQDLIGAPDINDLVPTDTVLNGYPSIGDYTAAVDAEKLPLFAEIAAAQVVEDLYGFSPAVPEPPNYTP
jgi:hypothetical protein